MRFGVIGVVAGPFVGAAAAALRQHGRAAAVGTAVLSGIGLGEATYGVVEVRETTGLTYWVAVACVALALLAWALVRRTPDRAARLLALGGAVAVAAAFAVVYRLVGTI